MNELVKALSVTGNANSQVSLLCGDLDECVGALLNRPIAGGWPHLYIGATDVNTREAGSIVRVAVNVSGRSTLRVSTMSSA